MFKFFRGKRRDVVAFLRKSRGRKYRSGNRGKPRHYFTVTVGKQKFTVFPHGMDKTQLDAAKASSVLLGGNYLEGLDFNTLDAYERNPERFKGLNYATFMERAWVYCKVCRRGRREDRKEQSPGANDCEGT